MYMERNISREVNDRLAAVKRWYIGALKEMLEYNGLDGDVVRKRDGAVGVLRVAYDICATCNARIKFFPYKKNGDVSANPSGVVITIDDFEPKKD